MFSLVSVRPRGRRCTPPGQTPPTGQTNPLGRQTPSPWAPPRQTPHLADTLPRQTPQQTATAADGTHPAEIHLVVFKLCLSQRLMKKSQTQDAVYCEHFKSSIFLSYIFQFKFKNGDFHNFSFGQNGNVKLSLKERSKICS